MGKTGADLQIANLLTSFMPDFERRPASLNEFSFSSK